jgi:aminopeptidase YwaD
MPDTDAPYVLLGGHIDGWHYGATDEGASNAAMMELAIAFHRQRARLRRGLVVAWWPGHSNARYGGSTWFADRFFTELRDRGVAYLNIDGVGQMNAKRFSASGTVSLEAFAQRIVSNRVGADINVNRPGRNSDQAFNGIGLPLMQFNHTRLAEDGGYWWWHTEDDTFEKVDMSILETDAEIYGDALTALLTGTLPLDVAAQTRALVAELERRNGQADERLDLSEAVNLAQRLHDKVATYYNSGFNTATPNLHTEQALIRFLRPLHRIMYSPLDPYHPDPGTNLGMLPGLAPVSILSEESPQSDRYRFAIATLIRERNRVLDAIDQSIQILSTISNPTGRE